MNKVTDVRLRGATLYLLPMRTRIPLKFGPETLTEVTCARVSVRVTDQRGSLAEGWGEDFSRAVYSAQFAEGRQIGSADVIGAIVRDLGRDDAVLARAQSDAIKQKLRAETEEAQRLGIFGAPSFVAGSELFWGNDRLEQAIASTKR